MKKISNKWLMNYLISVISIMLVEIIFKFISGSFSFDYSLLRILSFANVLAIIIGYLLSFLPIMVAKIFHLVLTFILSVYSFAQLGFNNFIGVYMSLNTTSQLGAVKDYVREFLLSFKWTYYFSFITFILLVLYCIFVHKYVFIEKPKMSKTLRKKYGIKDFFKFIFLELSMMLVYYSTLTIPAMQNVYQTQNNLDLFINPSTPSITIKQLGITAFGLSDLRIKFFPVSEDALIYSIVKSEKKIETDYTRHLDDEAFRNVVESETNSRYKTLNDYFINQNITDKNDYTGMFENKNVIVIMLESVNDIIINQEYYPNFYKMYSEGWHWKNNYSPRNSCSTGNNELSGMTGLYSIYNSCTANVYKKNTYFEGIFNLFNNKGYYTTSMHDYTQAYYYRATIHPNIGSQKFYGVEQLGIPYQNEYKNWASDEDFMNAFLKILDGWNSEQHFMTWLTTVSSHQPYVVSSILGDKNLDMFADKDYPQDLKRYMSKLKVLDNSLGILLDGLEERGILDDTLIVMFGDHYPYGLNKSAINKVLDYNLDNYEAERVPFVIYNPSMETKEFEEYTSYVNILPTVANLCNLDYDPRLYMGTDILSSEYEDYVVFADGSWKNKYAYFNASIGKLTEYEAGHYSPDDVTRINETISLKMKMSSAAIKNNYFNYLEKAIKKEQEKLSQQKLLEQTPTEN